MAGVQIWDIDRLVASKILTDLGIESSEEAIDTIARHAADHRQDAALWAAGRVQEVMMDHLSECIMSIPRKQQAEWYDGFREAEACMATISAGDALQIAQTSPATVGAIVRGKIRQARLGGSPL